MSDDVEGVERTTKHIEVSIITLKSIQITEAFYKRMKKGILEVEEKSGKKMGYGEYLEKAIDGLTLQNILYEEELARLKKPFTGEGNMYG